MSAQEMYLEFLNKLSVKDIPADFPLETDDIFQWINEAQDMLIDTYYGKFGAETSQGVIDALLPLTRVENVIPTLLAPGIYDIDVTQLGKYTLGINVWSDYMHLLRLFPIVNNECNYTYEIRQEIQDRLNVTLVNTFTKPKKLKRIIYTLVDNNIRIYTDNEVILTVDVTYLRRPKRITVNIVSEQQFQDTLYTNLCELPLFLHKDVVSLAVDLFISNTKPQQSNG